MTIVLDGTNGISTPDLESAGPVTGTTATFSGNVTLGSSVLATPTGSAPSYTCRAWVNFNGTGTVAIRASGNVSSITDGGVGVYTVNFTTALPDANFSCSIQTQIAASNQVIANISAGGTMTSSALPIVTIDKSGVGAAIDVTTAAVSVFR